MSNGEHIQHLMRDAENIISRYLKGELSEEYVQHGIDAIGAAFDNSVNSHVRGLFADLPDKIEEIILMEFPVNKRKLVETEILELLDVIRKYNADSSLSHE